MRTRPLGKSRRSAPSRPGSGYPPGEAPSGLPVHGGRMTPGPDAAPALPPPAPASAAEKTAWILMGAALLFAFEFHLVPTLLAGLFVYSTVHAAARRLSVRL